MRLRIFSCAYWQLVFLLLKKSQLVLCSLKNWVIYLLIVGVWEFFIYYGCYQTWFTKLFSYVVGCLFTFLRVFFKAQRFLILIKVQFTLFPLLSLLLALYLRNYCLIQGNKVWYLCFLLRVLQFWFLYWALIHSVSLLL